MSQNINGQGRHKITREIVQAFLQGKERTIGNSRTARVDGFHALFLHGNMIATLSDQGALSISAAGWLTKTTKERLNGLPGVSIVQKNYDWYLNGKLWGGTWITV